jgi:DNA-binding MarR family transcriptional regulator
VRTARHSRQSIAKQLARVQGALAALGEMIDSFEPELPDEGVSAEIRSILRARQRRESIFPDEGFGDPGWDLLLELYSVALAKGQIAISELGAAASVPPSTALRWLGQLEQSGLIERMRDSSDKRRTFVRLSAKGLASMRKYFGQRDRG